MRLSLPLPPQVFSSIREGTKKRRKHMKNSGDQTGDGIYFTSNNNCLQKRTCSLERVVSLLTEEKVMQMRRSPGNTNLQTLLLKLMSAQAPLVQFGARAGAHCLIIFHKRTLPCLPYLPLGHYITPWGIVLPHTPHGELYFPMRFLCFFASFCPLGECLPVSGI